MEEKSTAISTKKKTPTQKNNGHSSGKNDLIMHKFFKLIHEKDTGKLWKEKKLPSITFLILIFFQIHEKSPNSFAHPSAEMSQMIF